MGQGMYKLRKRKAKNGSVEKTNTMDRFMYGIALIAPFLTIPQLIYVWTTKDVNGVSVATWGGYACVSVLWFVYALKHNEKPLMLTHFLLFVLDASIVVGIAAHH